MGCSDVREGAVRQACEQGDLSKLRLLAEDGAPLQFRDGQGITPIHVACRYNQLDVARGAGRGNCGAGALWTQTRGASSVSRAALC